MGSMLGPLIPGNSQILTVKTPCNKSPSTIPVSSTLTMAHMNQESIALLYWLLAREAQTGKGPLNSYQRVMVPYSSTAVVSCASYIPQKCHIYICTPTFIYTYVCVHIYIYIHMYVYVSFPPDILASSRCFACPCAFGRCSTCEEACPEHSPGM